MRELHGVSTDAGATYIFRDDQEVRAMVAMVSDRVVEKLRAAKPKATTPTAAKPAAKPFTRQQIEALDDKTRFLIYDELRRAGDKDADRFIRTAVDRMVDQATKPYQG